MSVIKPVNVACQNTSHLHSVSLGPVGERPHRVLACNFNGLHSNCWDLDFSRLNMKPLFDRPGVATAERCRAATMSSSADKTRAAQMH